MDKDLTCIDAEYFIQLEDVFTKHLIIGVRSKILNANCAMRINDEYLSTATCETIAQDLQTMESNMVYQANNNTLAGSTQ